MMHRPAPPEWWRNPTIRARLLAAFLAVNAAMGLLSLLDWIGWGWLVPGNWLGYLSASLEQGIADRYHGVLFGVVAVLAAAQAPRRPPPRVGPRWLWAIGWVSLAALVGLIAVEELNRRVDAGIFVASALGLMDLAPRYGWVLVAAPLAAPLAAAALWCLLAAQRGHPLRALLTGLALFTVLVGLLIDATQGELLLYRELVGRLGFPSGLPTLHQVFEEGAEQMAAAALAVVLIDMLAARSTVVLAAPRRRYPVRMLVIAALLTGACTYALLTPHVLEGDRWVRTLVYGTDQPHELVGLNFANDTRVRIRPSSYAGPISLIEQPFRASHDNLTRIEVWAEVDGAPESATIFARLTPEGADAPIRESRAEVRAPRFSNATVAFEFAPIPDSGGTTYTLAVGVLSGPKPYVFLGLTDRERNLAGAAVVNGAPTRHADDLAMRTFWIGRFIRGISPPDPRYWALIGEVMLYIILWILPIVVTWGGLSGAQSRFWRGVAWPAVRASIPIATGIVLVTLALFALLAPTRL